MKNDNPSPETVKGQARSGDMRRHRLAAVDSDADEIGFQDGSGNLSRIFTILLLLHVFLIGAVVLYNIVAKKPEGLVQEPEVAPNAMAAHRETEDSNKVPRSQLPASQTTENPQIATVEYIVRPGQNLQIIAEITGATSEQLIRLNNLHENGALYVGRKLKVPAASASISPEQITPSAPADNPMPALSEPLPSQSTTTVAATEPEKSLETAKRPEPSPTPRATSSQVAETQVKANSALEQTAQKRPEATTAKTPPSVEKPKAVSSGSRSYEVQSGDTFYAIARKHKVDVKELMKLNGYNDASAGKLRKGVVLKLP